MFSFDPFCKTINLIRIFLLFFRSAGLIRAIHFLAGLKSAELVDGGFFSNSEEVFNHFLQPFPWLVLEVQEALRLKHQL